jgi:hypothetical protein
MIPFENIPEHAKKRYGLQTILVFAAIRYDVASPKLRA